MNCNWQNPSNPKAAKCPFNEQLINSRADIEEQVSISTQGTINLQITRQPYGRCFNRYDQSLVKNKPKNQVEVRAEWPEPEEHFNASVYLLRNDDPNKAFIPGYSGLVPRLDNATPGSTFWRATHEALNEFTDSMLPEKGPVNHSCDADEDHHSTTCPLKSVKPGGRACHKGCNPPDCNRAKYNIH